MEISFSYNSILDSQIAPQILAHLSCHVLKLLRCGFWKRAKQTFHQRWITMHIPLWKGPPSYIGVLHNHKGMNPRGHRLWRHTNTQRLQWKQMKEFINHFSMEYFEVGVQWFVAIWCPVYLHGLIGIRTWINNYIHSVIRDEITPMPWLQLNHMDELLHPIVLRWYVFPSMP